MLFDRRRKGRVKPKSARKRYNHRVRILDEAIRNCLRKSCFFVRPPLIDPQSEFFQNCIG